MPYDFMKEVIDDSAKLWEDAANCRFINEMADSTLSKEKFLDYIIQDSIYLRDYMKIFAYAITVSKTWKDMQLYYAMLGYVDDGENKTRLSYLADAGMTDADVDQTEMHPQCRDYCAFLKDAGQSGDELRIIMAMLPCMLGYGYVFQSLRARAPQVMETYFGPLVADYTMPEYTEYCEYWIQVTNEKCASCTEKEKKDLMAVFHRASEHELWFWQMAGEDR